MGKVLETRFNINIIGFALFFSYLVMRQLQSFFGKPFLRRGIIDLFKIPSECGQASAGKITKSVQRHVEHIMALHKICKVEFTGFLKVGQQTVNAFVNSA